MLWFYRSNFIRNKTEDVKETSINDYTYRCIKLLQRCNSFSLLVETIMDETNSRNKDYIMDIIKGWSLLDASTKFIMKTDEKSIYEYKFILSKQSNHKPIMIRDKLMGLKEMYEIVKEFTERDYSNEDDISFYFDEIEPSIKVGQTVDLDYQKIKQDYMRLHKPATLKQEAIDYLLLTSNIDTQLYYIRKGIQEEVKIKIFNDMINL